MIGLTNESFRVRGTLRSRAGLGGCVLSALAAFALLGAPQIAVAADPEPHEILWAHPSPSAVGAFVIFVSAQPGDVAGARQINVGKPRKGSIAGLGTEFRATVDVASDEVVAVGAKAPNGTLAAVSVWLPPSLSTPGQPFLVGP